MPNKFNKMLNQIQSDLELNLRQEKSVTDL